MVRTGFELYRIYRKTIETNSRTPTQKQGEAMFTKKLFKDDVYKKECTAVVTEIRKSEDHTDIILDQTIFFPEGGGQPSDKGLLIFEDRSTVFPPIFTDAVEVAVSGLAAFEIVNVAVVVASLL